MTKAEIAVSLHDKGYNCAQSVVCAFAKEIGIDPVLLRRITEPFGRGQGDMEGPCGALSGAIAVCGLCIADKHSDVPRTKQASYAAAATLCKAFNDECGSRTCAAIKAAGTTSCARCIEVAAALAERMMWENAVLSDEEFIRRALPVRTADSHKGDYGRALLICGSDRMPGAAALAALGALRMGVGLTEVASTRAVIEALSGSLHEPIWFDRADTAGLYARAEKAQAVAIGCGMGQTKETEAIVRTLLGTEGAPLVIDADGINVLAGKAALLKSAKRQVVLTPHPLEFSRLSGRSVEEIQADRENAAARFAEEYGVTLLLKGHGTVITDGDTLSRNPTGGSALAKGGSGDVLCGMIAAFLAEGCTPLDACAVAAYLHGAAGDALAKVYSDYGVLADELPAAAAKVLCELRGGS